MIPISTFLLEFFKRIPFIFFTFIIVYQGLKVSQKISNNTLMMRSIIHIKKWVQFLAHMQVTKNVLPTLFPWWKVRFQRNFMVIGPMLEQTFAWPTSLLPVFVKNAAFQQNVLLHVGFCWVGTAKYSPIFSQGEILKIGTNIWHLFVYTYEIHGILNKPE